MLHITYWFPNDNRIPNVYHYYGDIAEKDEVIKELIRCGYEYEIEVLEEEPLDRRPLD